MRLGLDMAITKPARRPWPSLAFPGAMGFGASTRGGRFGQIIHVTNLNDAGAGSLRAALTTEGPRIIVFDVGGTIQLTDWLTISDPYVTIAGETAPEPGIQIIEAGISIDTHDVIVRHLRIRPGDASPGAVGAINRDCLQIVGGNNIIVDHCSLEWAMDEAFSVWAVSGNVHSVTVQNCIIGETLDSAKYGAIVGTDDTSLSQRNIAFIRNLFCGLTERGPRITQNSSVLVCNNVVSTITSNIVAISTGTERTVASVIGNVWQSAVANANTIVHYAGGASTDIDLYLPAVYNVSTSPMGNIKGTNITGSLNTASLNAQKLSSDPFSPPLTFLPADTVLTHVTTNAGARPAFRDTTDARIVSECAANTLTTKETLAAAGGPEVYAPTSSAFATPAAPQDRGQSGYTLIEEALHAAAAAVE